MVRRRKARWRRGLIVNLQESLKRVQGRGGRIRSGSDGVIGRFPTLLAFSIPPVLAEGEGVSACEGTCTCVWQWSPSPPVPPPPTHSPWLTPTGRGYTSSHLLISSPGSLDSQHVSFASLCLVLPIWRRGWSFWPPPLQRGVTRRPSDGGVLKGPTLASDVCLLSLKI